MLPRSHSTRALFAGTALALAALAGALGSHGCSDYGEGDRCETENNNDDCQDGLVCKQLTGVNGGRCCPPDLSTASPDSICSQKANAVGGDAAPATPDGSTTSDASKSDASDAASDATGDATSDAATDAAQDGSSDASGD